MAATLKPGWSKPSTILFASEIPANEKALSFALAQAREFGANLILFHAYDTMVVAASETSGIRYYDYAAAARAEIEHLEPLAEQIRAEGISLRNRRASRPCRRPDSRLSARAGRGSHCDGNAFSRSDRQAAGRIGGRSGAAHCQGSGVHRRPGCRRWRSTATLPPAPSCAPSACMRSSEMIVRLCRRAGGQHHARLDAAACDPAPGTSRGSGRPHHRRD